MSFCAKCYLPLLPGETLDDGCSFLHKLQGEKKLSVLVRMGLGLICFLLIAFQSHRSMEFFTLKSHLGLAGLAFFVVVLWGYPLFCSGVRLYRRGLGLTPVLLFSIIAWIDFVSSLVFYFNHLPPLFPPFSLMGSALMGALLFLLLESFLRQKTATSFFKFKNILPARVRKVLGPKNFSEIEIATILPGDIVSVNPGEIVPCDGIILNGWTSVDESILTGESTISFKGKGDSIKAGVLNRDASISIKMEKPLEEHFISRLQKGLEHVLKYPAIIQKKIDFWLTTFVVLGTLSVFLFFIFYSPAGFVGIQKSFFITKIFLLAAVCFVTARSFLAILLFMSLGLLVHHGLYTGSPNFLTKLSRINRLLLSKVGVLTAGQYQFSNLYLEQGVNQGTFLTAIFSLEKNAQHPLARGMETHPWYGELEQLSVRDLREYPALGVSGYIKDPVQKDHFVLVGNQRFLKRNGFQISRAMRDQIDFLESIGETVVLCGWDGQSKGVVSFSDCLRKDSKDFVGSLKSMDIIPVMVTADHDEMISPLMKNHGLTEIYTRCLTEEKIKKIENYKKKGECVGYIAQAGDEDSLIKKADISFLMNEGALSSDQDTLLIPGKKLLKVTDALRLAKKIRSLFLGGWALGSLYAILILIFLALGWIHRYPESLFLVVLALGITSFFSLKSLKEFVFLSDDKL